MPTLSDFIVPTFLGGLSNLGSLVAKAEAHAKQTSVEVSTLLEARLAPDMFTFTQQVQAAADVARRGVDRLSGVEPGTIEDTETTASQLRERIQTSTAHVKAADRGAIDARTDEAFTVSFGPVSLDFTGLSYAQTFAIPNFLFHVTTAYDILRHKGVALGKRDFIAPFIMAAQSS